MNEATKSANNWEGSLNRLSNTWTDTVQNFVNSDDIITVINSFNGFLTVVKNIIEELKLFPIVLGSAFMALNTSKSGGLIRLVN